MFQSFHFTLQQTGSLLARRTAAWAVAACAAKTGVRNDGVARLASGDRDLHVVAPEVGEKWCGKKQTARGADAARAVRRLKRRVRRFSVAANPVVLREHP